jgi:PAS domain S-box-containing protein
MSHESYRVLIIDDSPDVQDTFRSILTPRLLSREPDEAPVHLPRFEVDCADQGEQGVEKVREAAAAGRPYALIFVDGRMPPGMDGVTTIEHLWKIDPTLEVVLCTGFPESTSEELARRLKRIDLLILKKPFDNSEARQLAFSLTEKWRLTHESQTYFDNLEALVKARTRELEQSIALIRASESQYRLLFESNPTPIYTYDPVSLRFLAVNDAAALYYGYDKAEFLSMSLKDVALPEELPAFLERLAKVSAGSGNTGVWRHRTKDGKLIQMEIVSHSISFGSHKAWLSLAMDVTERLNLEAQLRQSQKMESIGQLAGGIAHDFNNLLTVINGHAGMITAGEPLSPKASDSVKEIAEAGKRASELTRQLMTFSRKQEIHPQVVDLNEVVNNVNKMLRRILGEDITLHVDFASRLPAIKADPGMIEQILLNLAVNSRDAMPRGGELFITSSAMMVNEAEAVQNPEATAGQHVCLSFRDTGTGISPEHISRIFEPFFTTKPLERGTGLGLATVYGIVKQHRGWINVSSVVGQGAKFEIFLPACAEKSGALRMTPTDQRVIGGTETILLVEDEAPLLRLMHHILESHGYETLDCSNMKEALAKWHEEKARIDLLLTDLILPDGSGRELAKAIQAEDPELEVIYTSGYNIERLAKEFPPGEQFTYVQKPFHARKLAEVIYDTFNAKPGA